MNVSEGRDPQVLRTLASAVRKCLLDVHSDAEHNRSVFTLAGRARALDESVRSLAETCVDAIDLRLHTGAHPRFGSLDVVPFVALCDDLSPSTELGDAIQARDRFAQWAGSELELPCFVYGPERNLPFVRRHAFDGLDPDTGPPEPNLRAGACAVGARPALVAYNLWLERSDHRLARAVAKTIRSDAVRALGLAVGTKVQVSCNLLDPLRTGPLQVYEDVARLVAATGNAVSHAELVGLAPMAVVEAVPKSQRRQLGLDTERTIEARLAAAL